MKRGFTAFRTEDSCIYKRLTLRRAAIVTSFFLGQRNYATLTVFLTLS